MMSFICGILKNGTKKWYILTEQKQTHRQKKTYGCQRGNGAGRDKLKVWDQQIHTTTYIVDKQQGPTVNHRELYSLPCTNL